MIAMFRLTLMSLIYFSAHLNTVLSNKTVMCDSGVKVCTCRYSHDNEQDFLKMIVDCSFKNFNILNNEYSLPVTVHTLDLSSNNLTDIVKVNMLQSHTMKMLMLNKNFITTIQPNSFSLPNLTHLDLSDNYLEFIEPTIFDNIINLIYLNIASNKLTYFATMTFQRLTSLKHIIFDNNNIGNSLQNTSLFHKKGLSINAAITHLSIGGIQLNSVPNDFLADAYNLRYLKISNNNLSAVPQLPFTLEYLDISDNPIPEIDFEDFCNVPAIEELQLNNLEIKEVPDFVFEPLKGLKKLSLERNNNMTNFSAMAFGKDVLVDADDFPVEELSLQGSKLTTLSKDLLVPFGQLSKLNLQGNLWECDCNIVWLKKLQIPPSDSQFLKCYTPKMLHGIRLLDIGDKHFKCKITYEPRLTLAAIALIAFVLLLVTIATWFFVFIPRYQSRGRAIQDLMYPATSYLPVPINRNELEHLPMELSLRS